MTESLKSKKQKPLKVDKFIEVIHKYKNPEVLTRDLLTGLIDKISVHEGVGKGKNKQMTIDVFFNFIGQYDLPPSPEELAEDADEKTRLEAKRKDARKDYYKKYQQKKKAARYAENEGHKFAKRVCEHCGKEYWPGGNKQKYCSEECSYAVYLERLHEKAKAEKGDHSYNQKNCIVCGKPFWPSNGKELMCSQECKDRNRREKQKAYYHRKIAKKQQIDTPPPDQIPAISSLAEDETGGCENGTDD